METRIFKALKRLGKSKGIKDVGKLKSGERTSLIKELRSSDKSYRYGMKDMEKWVGRKLKGQRLGKQIASMPTAQARASAQATVTKTVAEKSKRSVSALKSKAKAGKGGAKNPFTAKAKADAAYSKARKGKVTKALKGQKATDRTQQWTTKRQVKKNTKNQATISQEAAGNRAYAKSERAKDMGTKKTKLQDGEYWNKFKDWASRSDVQTGALAGGGTALLGSALLGD